jgi:hypothetical protein
MNLKTKQVKRRIAALQENEKRYRHLHKSINDEAFVLFFKKREYCFFKYMDGLHVDLLITGYFEIKEVKHGFGV